MEPSPERPGDRLMDELMTSRETGIEGGTLVWGARRIRRAWRGQLEAALGTLAVSSPVIVILAIGAALATTVGGPTARALASTAAVAYGTLAIFTIITVGSVFERFRFDRAAMLREAAESYGRNGSEAMARRQLYALFLIGISIFIGAVVSVAVAVGYLALAVAPALLAVVAVGTPWMLLAVEKRLVREHDRSLAGAGISLARRIIVSTGTTTARERTALHDVERIAKVSIYLALGGPSNQSSR